MADLSVKNSVERKEAESSQKLEDQQKVSIEKLDTSDVRAGLENAEVMTTGEVSEDVKEDRKVFNGAAGSATAAQTAQAALAKQVKIPSVEIMRKQVAVEIRKEIRLLEHQAKKIMSNPSEFSPFTLNGMVSKIRELKEILGQLAYATVENLKSWWMKYVKGITI